MSGRRSMFSCITLAAVLGMASQSLAAKVQLPEGEVTAVYIWQRDSDDSNLRANKVSMAGQTEVVIHAVGMDLTPQNNFIELECTIPGHSDAVIVAGPELDHENTQNSNMGRGLLQYTLPDIKNVLGLDSYAGLDLTTCKVNLIAINDGGAQTEINCSGNDCKIVYREDYTPNMIRVLPQAVPFNIPVTFFVDTSGAPDYRTVDEEFPFRMGFIDESNTNYEVWLDETSTINSWSIAQITGQSGDAAVNETSVPRINFHVGDARLNEDALTTCTYDMSDCYMVKSISVVDNFDFNTGYTEGGQVLDFQGTRLSGYGETTITIDGEACEPILDNMGKENGQCLTKAKAAPSSEGNYIGQHGARREIYEAAEGLDIDDIVNTGTLLKTELLMALEIPTEYIGDDGLHRASIVTGYFVPPADNNYKFHVTCDDKCVFSMSTLHQNTNDLSELVRVNWAQSRGYYYDPDRSGEFSSSYLTLNAGSAYYYELRHLNNNGGGYFKVDVEIQNAPSAGHHQSIREVQYMKYESQNPVKDTTVIRVPNDNTAISFSVAFRHPETMELIRAENNMGYASASSCKSSVQPFFSDVHGSWVTTEIKFIDDDSNEVDSSVATFWECWVYMTKSIEGSAWAAASATTGGVTVFSHEELHADGIVQEKSLPLSGYLRIQVPLADGSGNTQTDPINYESHEWQIRNAIYAADPNWRGKLFFSLDYWSQYYDRKNVWLFFDSYVADPALFKWVEYTVDPLETNEDIVPISGGTVQQINTQVVKAFNGNSIFYGPVPYEMIKTQHAKPQILMTVDGLPTACRTVDCDYMYETAPAVINSHAVSGTSAGDTLTIDGANFPENVRNIDFGDSNCDVTTVSETQIECQFDQDLAAGTFLPAVTSYQGVIPDSGSDTPTEVALSITDVQPSTLLNPNGGTQITITGTGFPVSLANAPFDFKVTFLEGTECVVSEMTSTQIICAPNAFSGNSLDTSLQITVNLKVEVFATTVGTNDYSVTAVAPASISPVLKDDLVITLDTTMDLSNPADFTVYLENADAPENNKELNVYDSVPADKTIKARFGGAWSGKYTVNVVSATQGKFSSSVELDVSGSVTSFTPTQGSVHGGTIVTLTGVNFDDDKLNNPVNIGWDHCEIISSSPTEIVFRTPAADDATAGHGEVTEAVIVGLKTSEEAVCNFGAGCYFAYKNSATPTLNSATPEYDSTNNYFKITLAGSGFGSDAAATSFLIDGNEQEIVSVSDSEVVVKVSNIVGTTFGSMVFYSANGIPANHATHLTAITDLTPYQTLLSVTPQQGSEGGSQVILNVSGVGSGDATEVDALIGGLDACETATIVASGKIACKLFPGAQPAAAIVALINSSEKACKMGGDDSGCFYETVYTPVVNNVINTGTQLILVGSDLEIAGFSQAEVTFNGVMAIESTIDNSGQITATFEYGVPFTASNGLYPVVALKSDTYDDDFLIHYATVTQTTQNTLSISSAPDITCSFAGGCPLAIDAPGLTSALHQEAAEIQVCGYKCPLNLASSTHEIAVCDVPAMSTIYSQINLNIQEAEVIEGETQLADTEEQANMPWDGNNQVNYVSENADCYFGTDFGDGKVGVLRKVAFMMNPFDSELFTDALKFQRSSNGNSWSTIKTFDSTLHEGFNYINFGVEDDPNSLDIPAYRYYRFFNENAGGCYIGEVILTGHIAVNSDSSSADCDATIVIGDLETSSGAEVTYSNSKTQQVTSVSPKWGKVQGGEVISIFFEDLGSTSASDITVTIDGLNCKDVEVQSSTEITCETLPRTGLPEHQFDIFIEGSGLASLNGNDFLYVNLWSEEATWGYELPPIEGESVYIPSGLNLLVDIDETPILNLVLVEGSLIFAPDADPTHERFFDAHIIYNNRGYIEIGTEDARYTSKLTIALHGEKYGPLIPIFGNKVIANYGGTLDMHGPVRSHVFTELATTAFPGDKEIIVEGEVDWQVGEEIMLAPTAYVFNEDEVRAIKTVTHTGDGNTKITFDLPLVHRHFSETETFGNDDIPDIDMPMKGEVALLNRNVKFMGARADSITEEYGAHIVSHCEGDDCLTTRISYIEMEYVGQAFLLGRYPIHFHQIGAVHNSYIKGNSIYHTFNRAVTVHGTHYLRIIDNVAYDVLGHGYFIEDGVEENNLFEGNMIVKVKRSWSLLMTDQMSAGFFITNPNNIFRKNRAIAAERMGWWFSLEGHSSGPNASEKICPIGKKLGEFSDNIVHSNGMYGLRLFNTYIPKERECDSQWYEYENGEMEPSTTNPPVCAKFTDLIGWKNGRSCAITKRTGCIQMIDFRCIDNAKSQIEFSKSEIPLRGHAKVEGGLMVGYSINNSDTKPLDLEFGVSDPEETKGVTSSRQEFFEINNVNFFRFDKPNMAALFTCSQCFFGLNEDDARVTYVSGLKFDDDTVPYRLQFQTPFRGIVKDEDGSLTGVPGTHVTSYFKHHPTGEGEACTQTEELTLKYGGILCDPDYQVRRVTWYAAVPEATFLGQKIKIIRWDDDIIEQHIADGTLDAYKADDENYTAVKYDENGTPAAAWHMPFVTGHKYKVSWGSMGLDFENIKVVLEKNWEKNDLPIEIVHNHTDVRVWVNATTVNAHGTNITMMENGTYYDDKTDMGANVHHESEDMQTFTYTLKGNNPYKNQLIIEGARCNGPCLDDMDNDMIDETPLLWSLASTWALIDKEIPVEGEDVTVPPTWNLIYDVAAADVKDLGTVEIQGRLTFDDAEPREIRAHNILIRGGEFLIGDAVTPFPHEAKITLLGGKEGNYFALDPAIETGNKNLVVAGKAAFYGQPVSHKMTRLYTSARKGDDFIVVHDCGDWADGDEIGLAATRMDYKENDYAFISGAPVDNGDSCTINLDRELTYFHFGSEETDWSNNRDIDLRGEVFKLNRSVKIVGEDVETWGGQIVVQDFLETDLTQRSGYVWFDNIQVYNCSQQDTHKAAIRFELNTAHLRTSEITNSVFHHGNAWAVNIDRSKLIEFHDNLFFSFSTIGMKIDNSLGVKISGNYMVAVWERDFNQSMLLDKRAGYMIGEGALIEKGVWDLTFWNNHAIAVPFAGFIAPGQTCTTDYSTNPSDATVLQGNTAHSVNGEGFVGYRNQKVDGQETCTQIANIKAWKCSGAGVLVVAKAQTVMVSNSVVMDTGKGIVANNVGEAGTALRTEINDSVIVAESTISRDCEVENWCNTSELKKHASGFDKFAWDNDFDVAAVEGFIATCVNKLGTITPMHVQGFKAPVVTQSFMLPLEGAAADAAFAGDAVYRNVVFEGFNRSKTYCGKWNMQAITFNKAGSDIIPMVDFIDTTFIDSSDEGFLYMFEPPKGWTSVRECGSFPCTAPHNTALTFSGTKFVGESGTARNANFQVIPNNPELAAQFRSCKKVAAWNGYICQDEDFGVLHFESQDADAGKRNIYPVYVSPIGDNEGKDIDFSLANKLNQFREHTCDGIYPGLFRLGRFAALVGLKNFYNIDFTGTVPEKLQFKLQAHAHEIRVQVRYDYKNSFAVLKDGAEVEEVKFDDSSRSMPAIKGDYCGENKYLPVENALHFTITAGCLLQVVPRDVIRASIRMQWTFDEFFAAGGTTNFVDRLAASLNIHASTIKVVSVYQGSVIVEYRIEQEAGDLDMIENVLEQKIVDQTLDMGVTVISGTISDVEIDPYYWQYEEEKTEDGEVVAQPEYKPEEVYVKKSSGSDGQSKTAAIIIIAAALVVTITLLVAAYIILKNKFQSKQDRHIEQASTVTESDAGKSQGEDEFEKQYVPNVEFDDEKMNELKNAKANQEDVVVVSHDKRPSQDARNEYAQVKK